MYPALLSAGASSALDSALKTAIQGGFDTMTATVTEVVGIELKLKEGRFSALFLYLFSTLIQHWR